jgi:ribose/xylose/arabinose/galactoside ABC-type transport system permease subunit
MAEAMWKPQSVRDTARDIAKHVFRHEFAVLVGVLVVVVLVFGVLTRGKSLTLTNGTSILEGVAMRGIVTMGQTFVLLTGGIDLAVQGTAVFAVMTGAVLMSGTSGFPSGTIALMPMIGLAIGLGHGLLVSRVHIPSLIVTIASWQALEGAAWLQSGGSMVLGLPEELRIIGQGRIGFVPLSAIIFIVVTAISYFVLSYTKFGRGVYAVGGNPVNAYLCGINVKNTLLAVYVLSGVYAAITAVILISRLMVGAFHGMPPLAIDSIAAAVIGGVSIFGGRGTVLGALIGILILGVINNGMNLLVIGASLQQIVRGIIIIIAVAIDYLRRR